MVNRRKLIAIIAAVAVAIAVMVIVLVSVLLFGKDEDGPSRYDVKSGIASAESAASATMKAFGVTLQNCDEEDYDVSFSGWIEFDGSWGEAVGNNNRPKKLTKENAEEFLAADIKKYFSDVVDVKKGAAYIRNGMCDAVCLTNDGEYWGTYPGGVVTVEDYMEKDGVDMDECIERLEDKYLS
ncbi:MAG: hypothetical protein IJ010_06970 [Ruminococcus sp.]|nr:hypothetical protein [Ruminococcus sp.]MBQ9139655.1 hypothetical protein [Ruminococcus sp.]